MPYLPRNRRESPIRRRVFISLVVLVAGSLIFSLIDGLLIRIVSPLWKGENTAARALWNGVEYLKSHDKLVKENRDLKEQLASQSLNLLSCNTGESNTKLLLETFGRASTTEGTLASVLVRPPETPYDVLIIDAGVRDGLEVGNTVALKEGPEIGVVTEVMHTSSRVRLYSASGEKINAILERNSVPVVMNGRGGGGFNFVLPREASVAVGDRILSSGLHAALLGVVEDVEMAPTDAFKKVLVSSVVHPNTLRLVIVLP
jgi:cell shape-determining protein MreC